MQFSVSGHHFPLSDRTKSHVEDAIAKLEKFYNPVIDAHVTITRESRSIRTDVVVNVHAQTLKSSGDADKVHTSVDAAIDKMVRQLKKLHDKRRKPRSTDPHEAMAALGD